MGPQRDLFRFVTHFWEGVERGSTDECWPWKRNRSERGYGKLGYRDPATGERNQLIAHRVAYHLTNGAPPLGHVVMHTCDNPSCCNPGHLKTGTVADNNRDRSDKGRSSRQGPPPTARFRTTGEAHPMAKLTEIEVRQIRALCADGRLTQRQIAAQFGVSQALVKSINRRHVWKHVT